MDHSILTEKQDGECPIYSHRVYGEDCTLKKFSRLEEDEEPDTECQQIFENDNQPFVCKWEVCFNQKDVNFWDPDGFCVEECPEELTLNEEEKLCDPLCEDEKRWNPKEQKCLHYMNQLHPGLASINECGGEQQAKTDLWV